MSWPQESRPTSPRAKSAHNRHIEMKKAPDQRYLRMFDFETLRWSQTSGAVIVNGAISAEIQCRYRRLAQQHQRGQEMAPLLRHWPRTTIFFRAEGESGQVKKAPPLPGSLRRRHWYDSERYFSRAITMQNFALLQRLRNAVVAKQMSTVGFDVRFCQQQPIPCEKSGHSPTEIRDGEPSHSPARPIACPQRPGNDAARYVADVGELETIW
jgi:hypothetical protein